MPRANVLTVTWFALLLAGFALTSTSAIAASNGSSTDVLVLTVTGAIDPMNAQYVTRGLDQAAREGDQAVLVELDTPGGLDSAMRQITGAMIASPVPVIVYVTPSGARAGSAGAFIMFAADVAAMAPGTNVGAAHPVAIGGGGAANLPDDERVKVTNDAAAYARTLATTRHHNATWAEEAVQKSVALSADEALAQHVADVISPDRASLLTVLDGRSIARGNQTLILHTHDAVVRSLDLTFPERFLHLIDDPNIAYLLLTIGFWAIIAELFHPGAFLPGVVGVISLALGLTALQSLPLNLTGLVLIIMALGLFVADIKAPTHGALTAAGLVTFVVGSLMLFSPVPGVTPPRIDNSFDGGVSPVLVGIIAIGLTAFFAVVVRATWRARKRPPVSLSPSDLGTIGVATTDLAPGGSVRVGGESWNANTDDGPIQQGEKVVVVARNGLRLVVRRSNK